VRVLIQRVTSAQVTVAGETAGAIEGGVLLLVGMTHDDSEPIVTAMAAKIVHLRIFDDAHGVANRSLLEARTDSGARGQALVVSQFTLYASTKKGRRPSFTAAAPASIAEPLVHFFADQLRTHDVRVATGSFGAKMQVALVNDGPVTIWLDSDRP